MILLIDAGNTRVKWALAELGTAPGTWIAHGAVMHADLQQLELHLSEAVADRGVDRIVIANVAGGALRVQLEYVLQRTFPAMILPEHAIEWFASLPALAGVTNGYRNPAQLGCDRFAAAIAGHTLAAGREVIVANCGTATTIDAITADGMFLGGMILPGLGLMASSLARNTAQLPQIAQDGKLPDGFADNTDDAILSGCLAAQSGAIEHAYARHGASECIISGGAAPYIAPMLKVPYRIVENIVLIGLHAAAGSAE
ncbi:type III pantothenate kinase [Duganella sp. BJB488]|uniref:type III pantothenate kinase n=1 Tax=Duganella TaxID=75654 RepID=UPI000E3556B4|nr:MULTISPECIES: type III pantothenate kinase [unclassified Duganella]NVD70374.1 type III pantothenate kinase [Duganella sp. BJB1802]RFP22736.1 type III pantothenate kinase [Duganella sp. BJB489]RFP25189.1 type III pantothenate kinase [Duganella sp. BJB488]RFP33735.1 type III pantothenate kinase [Duganella sp. BJB480]